MKKRQQPPSSNGAEETFDPLQVKNLGLSIVTALLRRAPHPLPPPKKFPGSGLYALYYLGSHPAYAKLVRLNREKPCSVPIYVGRAVSKGGRKGGNDLDDADPGSKLYSRLCKHAKSIEATKLELADFRCRYLAVEETFITLAESIMIKWYVPVWNKMLDGFGNNAPGKNRPGMRPAWDTLHPGRDWAERLKDHSKTPRQLEKEIKEFLNRVELHKDEPRVMVSGLDDLDLSGDPDPDDDDA